MQVVRCLLIEPNPESALNEDAARLFMEVGLGKTTLFRNKYGIYVREYRHTHTHTLTHRERERETERETHTHSHTFIYTCETRSKRLTS